MLVKITQVSETNYTEEIELGEIEIESVEAYAGKISATVAGNTFVCEWGNGEGQDIFEFEILENNVS